jgi:hypothetical protein
VRSSVDESADERQVALEIYKEQEPRVRALLTEVLRIEREQLHLRDDKHIEDLLAQAVRKVVTE